MNSIKRDTNTDLMINVFELAKKKNCYEKVSNIIDYFLPEKYKVLELSNYEFDFLTKLSFGCSEGIYLTCYIEGCFQEDNTNNKKEILSCGTFKTLNTDLETMKIMGEFAGSLTYLAYEYINNEIDRYSPTIK